MKGFRKFVAIIFTAILMITSIDISTYAQAANVKVKSIVIQKPAFETLTLKKGDTYQLKANVSPANATNKKLVYKTSDKDIATVTDQGVIKAIKNGKTTITISSYQNSKIKKKIDVIIGTPISKVSITNKIEFLKVGESYKLKTKISPDNASDTKLVYYSGFDKVATVSSKGVITGVATGMVTISVVAKDGSEAFDTMELYIVPENAVNIPFKFYSSSAKKVYLYYSADESSWKHIEMTKKGNWFTASAMVGDKAWYLFVADDTWLIDPFSLDLKGQYNASYIEPVINGNTNFDCDIFTFSSEHFDYFSMNNDDKTKELEDIYSTLTKLLAFMDPKPVQSKIRYYGIDYYSDNIYSMQHYHQIYSVYNTSEVFDLRDCMDSHDLIHTLVSVQNEFFNDGIAQCFSYDGNMNEKSNNVNLKAKDVFTQNGTTDFMDSLSAAIQYLPSENYTPASFIYFNVEVLHSDTEFAQFLYSLTYNDSLEDIQTKYQTAMGLNMSDVVNAWEKWLNTINDSSDIYIKW